MAFTDKQLFEAIEKNIEVKECFNKISVACQELKRNTDCPDDDVDRFLESVSYTHLTLPTIFRV